MARKSTPAYITEQDVFARRLTEIMQKRGLNQTQLAAKIKAEQETVIQRQTISQYMSGQSKPDTDRLTVLCKALNVSADYLVGLRKDETSDANAQAAIDYTGLSEEAAKKLNAFSKKKDVRAYSDLLSLLICDPDFEWFLGVLEGYFAEEKYIQADFGVSRVVANNKNLAMLAATQGLPNILERISVQFKERYLTTDERLDIFTEKKIAEKEASKNGKH